jgi:hypothetical protein
LGFNDKYKYLIKKYCKLYNLAVQVKIKLKDLFQYGKTNNENSLVLFSHFDTNHLEIMSVTIFSWAKLVLY